MPLYEFICSECEQGFEELVRNHEAAGQVNCPACGGRQVRRKISTFATNSTGSISPSTRATPSGCAPGGT